MSFWMEKPFPAVNCTGTYNHTHNNDKKTSSKPNHQPLAGKITYHVLTVTTLPVIKSATAWSPLHHQSAIMVS